MKQVNEQTVNVKTVAINEGIKRYYPHIDDQILRSVWFALNDMRITDTNIDKIMILIAMACDKHFKYGFCVAKK